MRGVSESRWISIRLADGGYYTVFRRGDWSSQKLLLIPASENQDEADIEFYLHAPEVSRPLRIGMIKFADLPAADVELSLEAEITFEGALSVTVRHEASGRVENLKMRLPEVGVQGPKFEQGSRPRAVMRWLLGVLYVAIGLAIAFWLLGLVSEWGEQELPPPISLAAIELSIV